MPTGYGADVVPVDEHELLFSREEPLLAWRLFRVRDEEGGFALGPPMIHSPRPPSWSPGIARAECLNGSHAAPHPGCRCGIYGAVDGTLDSLPGYLCDTSYDKDPWAYGEIACSGRVFLDARGIRCEEARLVQVAVVEDSVSTLALLEQVTKGLASRYGVPVGQSKSAPQWLTANARTQGAPSSYEEVDLRGLAERLLRSRRPLRS